MATDRRLISWDTLWDKNGTSRQILSQGCGHVGQPKTPMNQGKVAFVPPSQTLGRGTLGQAQNRGTRLGTKLSSGTDVGPCRAARGQAPGRRLR